MSLIEIIILLVIAGFCGAIAQRIAGFGSGGCIVSIVVGFIGALIGTWLSRKLGLPDLFVVSIGTTNFPIIWSIIGAAVFVAVLSIFSPRRNK